MRVSDAGFQLHPLQQVILGRSGSPRSHSLLGIELGPALCSQSLIISVRLIGSGNTWELSGVFPVLKTVCQ